MARGTKDYFNCSYWKYKFFKIFRSKKYKGELSLIYNKFIEKSGLNKSINSSVILENDLNTNYFDKEIEDSISKYFAKNKSKFTNQADSSSIKISLLFTRLYSTGGHTPMVERFIESFCDEYNLGVFCTQLDYTKNGHYKNKKNRIFDKNIFIDGIDYFWNAYDLELHVKELYNKIISFNPKIIFCYIHPQDVVLVATLALIKKNTNIKIIDINMQDHFYSLGFKFADLIIDARPAGQRITKEIRGYNNTCLMPLQQKKISETKYFLDSEIISLKNSLGINKNQFFTLTGGAGYKFFGDNNSDYFCFVKNLLIKEKNLVHVVMSDFDENFFKIVDNIFSDNKELLERLKIIKSVPDFDIYMQACDLFIDTFPQGGALIHIDIMRNKKPSIVKINKENPVRSFEFYFPKDYQYMFDDISKMEDATLSLLNDKNKREELSQYLFNHYVKTYEFNIVKNKYEQIIKNYNNLEKFYGYSFY